MTTATGVSAIAAPASRAGPGRPTVRRTAATTSATVPTPMSASGTSSDQLDSPNRRIDRPITHSEAGVLSTVIVLPGSREPKNHAFQLIEPDWAAIA